MSKYNLITLLGPTASGKTFFGANLADKLKGEIISADSRQVYREMDLGTGKDYEDYSIKDYSIPFHLIDIHDPGYKYNLFEYQKDFYRVCEEIRNRGNLPILVGGTGMYIEAVLNKYELVNVPPNEKLREELAKLNQEELINVLQNYNFNLHNTSDLKIRKRTIRAIEIADHYSSEKVEQNDLPDINSLILGVKYDRTSRRKRISERLGTRLKEGLIDEVKNLLDKVSAEDLIYYGLEYKFISLYLTGKMDYKEMFNKLEVAIHQFAKRQMTWFRRMERNGFKIHWLDGHMPLEEKLERSMAIIRKEAPELIK
jgi:tRNA dimethylallyltransferase